MLFIFRVSKSISQKLHGRDKKREICVNNSASLELWRSVISLSCQGQFQGTSGYFVLRGFKVNRIIMSEKHGWISSRTRRRAHVLCWQTAQNILPQRPKNASPRTQTEIFIQTCFSWYVSSGYPPGVWYPQGMCAWITNLLVLFLTDSSKSLLHYFINN